jgi:DNA polymerase elongation subunit (family B)
MFDEIPWTPSVYVPTNEDTGIKSIDGKSVKKLIFNTYNDYYTYQKDCDANVLENNVKPEIQFLAERYAHIPDDQMETPNLRIYCLDIEVHSDKFPTAAKAAYPVTLISIYDNLKNQTFSFGLRPYDGKYKDEKFLKYFNCKDEETLLKMFFRFIEKYPCDVITGWNVQDFDLLYLINRCKNVFGEDTRLFKSFSPIKNVRTWEAANGKDTNVDIAGVSILDMMDLYKWYSPKKLERYSLDFVCKYELEKGKVDYSEYKDLRDVYEKNWNLYVEYNIIDAYRVAQLEEKLGYIKLVQSLSLLCKVSMKTYHAQTQLIEGLFLTYFRRNNLCAPHFFGGKQESYEAAYVKEPQPGKFEWVCDIDIQSSYPSHIITLNMSVETYYGRISDITEDSMVHFVKKKEFPIFHITLKNGRDTKMEGEALSRFNQALERHLLAIAPCGTVFSTSKVGVLADIERQVFSKRIEIKGKMSKMKKSLPELRGKDEKKAKEEIGQYNALQNALKIMLNAAFGITSVPYSRYFNTSISEAITSCGRQTVKAGERFVNELLNEPTEELTKIINEIKTAVGAK